MSEPETNVTKLYSRVARVYDAWTYLTESRSLRTALDRAAIRQDDSVLEVAVGTGIAFRELLRRNPSGRNVGVDLTEAMLRRAREMRSGPGRRSSSSRQTRGLYHSTTPASTSS